MTYAEAPNDVLSDRELWVRRMVGHKRIERTTTANGVLLDTLRKIYFFCAYFHEMALCAYTLGPKFAHVENKS